MLNAIERVNRFLEGVDRAKFVEDELVQSAVMYHIQIAGEAVRHLTLDFRQRYPQIPWQDIAGMRSRLVHNYFGVSLDAMWLAAVRDLPILEGEIRPILSQFEAP